MRRFAVVPHKLQALVRNQPIYFKQMPANSIQTAGRTDIFAGRLVCFWQFDLEQRILHAAIELSEVIEDDLRLRQLGKFTASFQITQQAIPYASIRNLTQTNLRFLHHFRERRMVISLEEYGKGAGEPSDGTCDIYIFEQLFPAMGFQVNG